MKLATVSRCLAWCDKNLWPTRFPSGLCQLLTGLVVTTTVWTLPFSLAILIISRHWLPWQH